MLVVPAFVRVSDNVGSALVGTVPKLRLGRVGTSAPTAATPDPETGIVSVGLRAVDVTVTVPVSVAIVPGLNPTMNCKVCPAGSVIGVVTPSITNPAPLIAICEIVMLDVPVFVTNSACVGSAPTGRLPKLRVV